MRSAVDYTCVCCFTGWDWDAQVIYPSVSSSVPIRTCSKTYLSLLADMCVFPVFQVLPVTCTGRNKTQSRFGDDHPTFTPRFFLGMSPSINYNMYQILEYSVHSIALGIFSQAKHGLQASPNINHNVF